jgi:hypothetical protein
VLGQVDRDGVHLPQDLLTLCAGAQFATGRHSSDYLQAAFPSVRFGRPLEIPDSRGNTDSDTGDTNTSKTQLLEIWPGWRNGIRDEQAVTQTFWAP